MNRNLQVVLCLSSVVLACVLACLALPGCVSVSIGPKGGQKSSNVDVRAPSLPYKAISSTPADGAWQSKHNGNSISYYSTCKDATDAPLDTVMRELFVELHDLTTIRTGNTTFNGREALDTEVEGKLDGVLTRIRAVVFKKNDCTYTISYIGVPKSFEEDRTRFNDFLGNFHAP